MIFRALNSKNFTLWPTKSNQMSIRCVSSNCTTGKALAKLSFRLAEVQVNCHCRSEGSWSHLWTTIPPHLPWHVFLKSALMVFLHSCHTACEHRGNRNLHCPGGIFIHSCILRFSKMRRWRRLSLDSVSGIMAAASHHFYLLIGVYVEICCQGSTTKAQWHSMVRLEVTLTCTSFSIQSHGPCIACTNHFTAATALTFLVCNKRVTDP